MNISLSLVLGHLIGSEVEVVTSTFTAQRYRRYLSNNIKGLRFSVAADAISVERMIMEFVAIVSDNNPLMTNTEQNNPLFDIFKLLANPHRTGFFYVPDGETGNVYAFFINASNGMLNAHFEWCYLTPEHHQQFTALVQDAIMKANSIGIVNDVCTVLKVSPVEMWLDSCSKGNVSIYQNLSTQDRNTGFISINVILGIEPNKVWGVNDNGANAPLMLISNNLNDTAMSLYINSICMEDAETFTTILGNTLNVNTGLANKPESELNLLAMMDVVIGDNKYCYFNHRVTNGIREIIITKNATPLLTERLLAAEWCDSYHFMEPIYPAIGEEQLRGRASDIDAELFKDPVSEGFANAVAMSPAND